MEQKVIITESQTEINQWLEKGWKIISVTARHVSAGASYAVQGDFCFVLERS